MSPRIYLDFEGYKNGTLALAGLSTGGSVRQVVVLPDLKPLAEAEGLEYRELPQFIQELVAELTTHKAELVAYSSAEEQTLKEKCKELGLNLGTTIKYHNIKLSAKKWINAIHRERFDALPPFRKRKRVQDQRRIQNSLASIMRLVGYEAPKDYAPGKTTKRINMVRAGLRSNAGIYEDLTPRQKADATCFMKHNDFDVAALPHLYAAIEAECPECLDVGHSTFNI
jgi:hypothetical protein